MQCRGPARYGDHSGPAGAAILAGGVCSCQRWVPAGSAVQYDIGKTATRAAGEVRAERCHYPGANALQAASGLCAKHDCRGQSAGIPARLAPAQGRAQTGSRDVRQPLDGLSAGFPVRRVSQIQGNHAGHRHPGNSSAGGGPRSRPASLEGGRHHDLSAGYRRGVVGSPCRSASPAAVSPGDLLCPCPDGLAKEQCGGIWLHHSGSRTGWWRGFG